MKIITAVFVVIFSLSAFAGVGKKISGKLLSYNPESFLLQLDNGKKERFKFQDTTFVDDGDLSPLLNKKIVFHILPSRPIKK
jgi:hypothetical protein